MTETLRKPAVFSVDDPRLVVTRPDEPLADEHRIGGARSQSARGPGASCPERLFLGRAVLVGAVGPGRRWGSVSPSQA